MMRWTLLFFFLLGQLALAQEWYTSLKFSPNGRHLAAGRTDGLLHLWEMPARQRLRRVPQMADSPIYEVDWYGTDTVLCRGCNQAGPYLSWSGVKKLFRFPTGHTGVYGAFSPDKKLLLTDSRDRILLWEIHFGKQVCQIDFATSRGSLYAFSPDSKRVAISRHGSVVVFDTRTGKRLSKLKKDPEVSISAMVFTPEGTLLTNDSQAVREWELETGKEVRNLGRGYSFQYSTALLLSSDGKAVLASGSHAQGWKTQYWPDRSDKEGRRELSGYPLGFLPNGGVVCLEQEEGQTTVASIYRQAQPVVKVELPDLVSPVVMGNVALSPDGKLLVHTVDGRDEIKWINLP